MPDSLVINLQNSSDDEVYAYVTGLDIQRGGARVLVQADGRSLYYPTDPPAILQPVAANVAIPLGPRGSIVTATIPQIAGGRIWFSRGAKKLTFLLNPSGNATAGAALVEPSVLNPADANAGVDFSFCEFTLNADQLFANISYVDFVSRLPIALTLQRAGGNKEVTHVSGMLPAGFLTLCSELRTQAKRDGRPWDKLIVTEPGSGTNGPPLRVLNATHGDAIGASFAGYYEPYVEKVRQGYAPNGGLGPLKIDTQAQFGVVQGQVETQDNANVLVIDGEVFPLPTTADVFGCNTGTFTTGSSGKRNAIIPRLAAAFNRSTLLQTSVLPSPDINAFYTETITNHYSRIVHEVNLDHKGYAFAYDDVQPEGGADQSGKVNAGDPGYFLVSVGGLGAYAGDRMP